VLAGELAQVNLPSGANRASKGGKGSMRNRARMGLLLTEQQSALLDQALAGSLAPSRSFFIAEAINAGLANPQPQNLPASRKRRIDVWLPSAVRKRIGELASAWKVSQQEVVRYFLLEYIRAAPWKQNQTQPMIEEETSS
jgi:metal-responsive CopG/Arc/MetJ family transcriptional regulator